MSAVKEPKKSTAEPNIKRGNTSDKLMFCYFFSSGPIMTKKGCHFLPIDNTKVVTLALESLQGSMCSWAALTVFGESLHQNRDIYVHTRCTCGILATRVFTL